MQVKNGTKNVQVYYFKEGLPKTKMAKAATWKHFHVKMTSSNPIITLVNLYVALPGLRGLAGD